MRPSPGSTFQVSRSGPSVSARIEAVRAAHASLDLPPSCSLAQDSFPRLILPSRRRRSNAARFAVIVAGTIAAQR